LPVLVVVDLAVAEASEQPLDVGVRDRTTQADFGRVRHRHQNRRLVGENPKMVEPARGTEDGLFFDALDYTETMIRVNDLVADLECHVSPVREKVARRRGLERVEPVQYTARLLVDQSKTAKNRPNSRVCPAGGHSAAAAYTAEVVGQLVAVSGFETGGDPGAHGRAPGSKEAGSASGRDLPVRRIFAHPPRHRLRPALTPGLERD